MSKKIKVAVITGGFSNERKISVMTGKKIAQSLSREKYEVTVVEISKKGEWLKKDENGKTVGFFIDNLSEAQKLKKQVDVAFIAMHGKFGEDGTIQAFLDMLGIPYTGSGVLSSVMGMDKKKCMEFVKGQGVKAPRFIAVTKQDLSLLDSTGRIEKELGGYPVVVKPNESGSSIGVSIAKNKKQLKEAVESALKEDDLVLVQEYVKGREFTCGVWGNTYKTEVETLPVVEIIAHGAEFFDYETKYFSDATEEICPARIPASTTKKIQNLAKKIHMALTCDGLTRSDFIIKDKGGIYFLEINTIPGQTEASLCPKEAKAIGMSFSEFLDHQIELALRK